MKKTTDLIKEDPDFLWIKPSLDKTFGHSSVDILFCFNCGRSKLILAMTQRASN